MERDVIAEFVELARKHAAKEELEQWYDELSAEERIVLQEYMNRQIEVVQKAIEIMQKAIATLMPTFEAVTRVYEDFKDEICRIGQEVNESGLLDEWEEFAGHSQTNSLDGGKGSE